MVYPYHGIQLTLEHGFELHESTYMWIFFNKYSIVLSMYFLFLVVFLITFSVAYFIVRIQYILHEMYKICVNQLFMLPVRLPVNSRLLIVNF